MSWVPRDLSQTCAVYTTVTTCSPSSLLFLQLIAGLFGRSRDDIFSQNSVDSNENVENEYGSHFKWNHGAPGYDDREEFDFVVVGAGSAGCVVANRLTEVPEWNVLLLEAGPEEQDVIDVPAFAPLLQMSSVDWGYTTQPSPHSCRARPNGGCPWVRGRVMGGSSSLNYLLYMRGTPLDYDEWAAQGNPGWDYKSVLPYFIKSEDNRNIEIIRAGYHGIGGYQTVEQFPYRDANVEIVTEGFRELGLEEMDLNADRQVGVMIAQHTTRDGERLTTNGAFIRPIRGKRRNLTVRINSQATRILIDPESKIAYGVEYIRNGKVETVYARKEVILSSGSLNSPKLLMLSGVGPSEHLNTLGINVIQDLSVGYNLHDHTTIDGVVFALTNKTSTAVDDQQMREDVEYYRQTHRGPLSATGPLQVNAMVQTKYASETRPDIQYSLDATNVNNFFTDPILTAETTITPIAYYDAMMVRPILLAPKSRGVVMLNNSDPIFGQPLIFANTFKERVDLLTIIEGIKQSLNLLRTESFRKAGIQLVAQQLPACRNYEFGTDSYWACIAQEYTTTIFHPVGTCKMGPKNDRSAVVDPKLRVYGIGNLRVIDASIMPIIPRGNTNGPTIMIGEKGSDLIKDRWLKTGDVIATQVQYAVTETLDKFKK
ncbi:glucose dehydrogenase [FAD, quinone]-like [Onthophagus taurus]|uniref:glucose dehydrogenase [FAD, quinone]-like n=1 Tax=Onthophagus taurus TaxID=166361 RepID=UPI0039BDADFC